ncbi:hypothetical protein FRC11_008970, partial [Ceratobasidium sp. 423]
NQTPAGGDPPAQNGGAPGADPGAVPVNVPANQAGGGPANQLADNFNVGPGVPAPMNLQQAQEESPLTKSLAGLS